MSEPTIRDRTSAYLALFNGEEQVTSWVPMEMLVDEQTGEVQFKNLDEIHLVGAADTWMLRDLNGVIIRKGSMYEGVSVDEGAEEQGEDQVGGLADNHPNESSTGEG